MTMEDLVEAVKSAPCERQSQEEVFELLMPKFKTEYNFDSVKDVLRKLGVKEILTTGTGDFGNLFIEVSYPSRRLRDEFTLRHRTLRKLELNYSCP